MSQRLHKARDETQQALAELGPGGAEARLSAREAATPQLEALQEENEIKQESLREAEERLASWQQRWEQHTRRVRKPRAPAMSSARAWTIWTSRSWMPTGVVRPWPPSAGLDVDALEEAFEQLHLQHDTQKAALDELSEDVELRKQGVAAVQEQQRNGQNELAELRKQANGLRGRLAPCRPRWARSRARQSRG